MSMLELFRLDAEAQVQALNVGLLVLERAPTAADQLESCMRAAHSLKGAARIVGLDAAVSVAHSMEDCFVAAQLGVFTLRKSQIDTLFRGVDLLKRIATTEADADGRITEQQGDVDACLAELAVIVEARTGADVGAPLITDEEVPVPASAAETATAEPHDSERVLRVTALHLNRLLGVAAESQVESRWLRPFAESLLRLKRLQYDATKALERLHEALPDQVLNERSRTALTDVTSRAVEIHELLSARLAEVQMFDRRSTNVAHRLHEQALACRMRPFADGTRLYPRLVRDLARSLDKHVRLQDCRRGDVGRPRYLGSARCSARTSSAQRDRSRHRIGR
jgi:two-component system sensor histidine kinase and response regulator WspE